MDIMYLIKVQTSNMKMFTCTWPVYSRANHGVLFNVISSHQNISQYVIWGIRNAIAIALWYTHIIDGDDTTIHEVVYVLSGI